MKVPEETLKAIKNSYPVFALWIKEKGYVSKPTESDIKLWYEFVYENMREVEPVVAPEPPAGADE